MIKYIFLLNGEAIERSEKGVKRFAASVPPDTLVVIIDSQNCIDKLKVSDIWDFNEQKNNNKI